MLLKLVLIKQFQQAAKIYIYIFLSVVEPDFSWKSLTRLPSLFLFVRERLPNQADMQKDKTDLLSLG